LTAEGGPRKMAPREMVALEEETSEISRSGLTPFIGRGPELAQLTEHLAGAREGVGRVVLVAGEPGVGKTRLVQELAEDARRQGCRILLGRAYESEGLPPYVPFIEALREYVRTAPIDQLTQELGDGGPEVALLVREVRTRLPRLPDREALGAEEERYRLFESVTEFLLRCAEPQGLLLALDDLHWADQSTLLLLHHLARRLGGSPLLLLGAYRTVDLDRTHPLSAMLAELSRERLYQRQLLAPLSAVDVRELMRALQGRPPAPEVVEAIYRETEGNAFFVEEVVRQLQAEGRDLADPQAAIADWAIPEGIRQVIGRRLAHLSPSANDLIRAAAVLGDAFPIDLLGQVSGLGEAPPPGSGSLVEALEEVLRSGLVKEDGSGYRFSHALVRQSVYAELSPLRRQQLHRRAGEAIEQLRSRDLDGHASELAHHFFQAAPAGVGEHAIAYATQAAEQATQLFAYDEAVRRFTQALEVQETLQPDDRVTRCELLLQLGAVLGPAGAPERVYRDIAESAFQLAEAAGDAARAERACAIALEALHRLGSESVWGTPPYRAWAERAARYAPPGSGAQARAELALGRVELMAGFSQGTGDHYRRALAAARQSKEADAKFEAALGILSGVGGWRISEWSESVALAREVREQSPVGVRAINAGRAYLFAAMVLLGAGDRPAAEELGERLAGLAERTRDPRAVAAHGEWQTQLATVDGRLEHAVALGEQLMELGAAFGGPIVAHQLAARSVACALGYLGRSEEAVQRYDALLAAAPGVLPNYGLYRDLLAVQAGLDPQATTRLEAGLQAFLQEDPADWNAVRAIYWLEVALLLRDPTTLGAFREPLRPLTGGVVPAWVRLWAVGRQLGEAAQLLGDRNGARDAYELALGATARIRYRPEHALTRLGLAELLATGTAVERAEAEAHLAFAIPELQAMQMQPSLTRALALQKDGALTGVRRPQPRYPAGLSEREVEVLRLLATGCSNREIAERLVLSLNTVARHVSHILQKTETANRVAAANFAHRHQLG
jgi:DNA-binding CsgD family transcriptional regulator